jgi:hypothetical protein
VTFWPFEDSPDTGVHTTRFVLDEGYPILLVSHDPDGAWQFLCGTTDESKDGRLIDLERVLELDETVRKVADLPRGWRAWRDSSDGPWIQEPFSTGELADYRVD